MDKPNRNWQPRPRRVYRPAGAAMVGRDRALARVSVLVFDILVLLIAVLVGLNAPTVMSVDVITNLLILGFSPLVAQIAYRLFNRRGTNWVSIDLTTMTMFAVIHFTAMIYWLYDAVPYEVPLWETVKAGNGMHRVPYSLAMAAAGLAAFAIGFNLLPDRYDSAAPVNPAALPAFKQWRVMAVRLVTAAAAMGLVTLFLLGPNATAGSYAGTESKDPVINIIVQALTLFLEAGAVTLAVTSFRLKPRLTGIGVYPATLLLVLAAAFAIQGDRNLPGTIVLIVGVVYSECIRRLDIVRATVFALCGAAAFSVLGIARVSPQRTLASMYETVMLHSDKIRLDMPLVELGSSVQPLFAAAAYIPDRHDYYYGKIMSYEIISIVPFVARFPVVQRIYEGTESYETGTASLLTIVILGNFDSGGKGTSSIADFYVNFGFPGVIVGMMMVGLIAKYLQQKARSSDNIFWLAMYTLAIPSMIFTQRASFIGQFVRDLVWPAMVMGFCALFIGRVAKRRRVLLRPPATPRPKAHPVP